METKLTVIDKCKREADFKIPAAELVPYFDKAYSKYRKTVNIQGFRKGKAPLSIIKQRYGEAIEYESLEHIAAEAFDKYLKENHIHTIGNGSLTDMDYKPGEYLKFKIQFEVKPEIELKQYKGIEAVKPVYEVDGKMIEQEIKYLLAKHSTSEAVQKAEEDECVITAEVQKLDKNNFPIIGYKNNDMKIYLNDKSLDPELKGQLKNIGSGESRNVRIMNREKNEYENYNLKPVKIERLIYPDLNGEFFKKISKQEITDYSQFENYIRKELEGIYDRVSEQELENNIISELIKLNDVPVPDALVEKILDSKIEEIRSKNPRREFPPDFDPEEYRKTNRVDVILQVKWMLIKEKLIEIEKIEIGENAIEDSVLEYSSKYNLPADKVRNLFKKNKHWKYDLVTKKLMKFLKDQSNIKEIKQTDEAESRIYA